MTVLEVIQRSTEFLQRKGVDSPRLQAELLLAHQLAVPRMRLYLDFEKALSAADLDSVRELVKRRGQREPLQQILGSTSFCGLEFAVNRHVLVPRPETELLAEAAWNFLGEQARVIPGPLRVLDLGTGSGCLAVTVAIKAPTASVCAVDISPDALAVAKENAARHRVADRLLFCLSDGFSGVPADQKFALIMSNPPYIPTDEIERLQPEVRDHEPRHALDGGEDGLRFYRRMAIEAPPTLRRGGRIMLEFGDGQRQAVADLFEKQNWVVEQVLDDYTRRPRILIARRNPDEEPNAIC